MHGKGKRTEAAHARAARASEGHGRALLPCAFLLALVALLFAPAPAFADANYRTVLWSGDYASGKQYIVGADNKYDAAAYICGQTSAQVTAYDTIVRYKLSATENDFASLADSLERDWPGWNEDTLAQGLAETFSRDVDGITLWDVMTQSASIGAGGGIIFNQGALKLYQVNYWQDSVNCDIYAVDTTSDAVSRARDDLQEILNGGGGGGAVATDTFDLYTMYSFRSDAISGQQDYGYFGYSDVSNNFYRTRMKPDGTAYSDHLADAPVKLTIDNFQLWNLPEGYTDANLLVKYANDGAYGKPSISFLLIDESSLQLTNCTTTSRTGTTKDFKLWQGQFKTRYYASISVESRTATSNTIHVTDFTYNTNDWIRSNDDSLTTYQLGRYNNAGWVAVGYAQSTEPDPPSGPGNWPDPPTDPEPPEPPTVPQPPENPEPDPPEPPVAPTPPSPEPPTNVVIPTGTTPQDYTPWLRAILEQLQTLTDELAVHCVHLQEEMQISVNELQDTLISQFNSLENHIWDLFNGLEDYMHDLAVWLADQLDYNVNVDPYDDTSVLYWLRQIYYRLGNLPKSPTNILDPDPTEPFDFWAWLMNLIADTVGGIIGDLVGDVAGLLDLFKDKFPFSIPWDIAALLALLDGTRATPVFDVKLVAVPGWWNETTFRIDLTPFNSVASACRTMVNIVWVMCLVMRTDWMLANMGDSTSFGERFARKVARTS